MDPVEELHSAKPWLPSDLIFPLASSSLNSSFKALRKSPVSTYTRLHSVSRDSEYVREKAKELKLPIVANERCGSWYVPPELKAGSAYFKSTDGHFGEWKLSLRRLNLQVLELAGKAGGCVIVDSTRRGKYFPDAQSKTVPIWCSVWNRILFPNLTSCHELKVPTRLISPSERAQIEARLPTLVDSLLHLNLPIDSIRERIGKPLEPIWLSQSFEHEQNRNDSASEYTAIWLLMPSDFKESSIEEDTDQYVQGAGDDAESWAQGLTPELFWRYKDELLAVSKHDLPSTISHILQQQANSVETTKTFHLLSPFDALKVGKLTTDPAAFQARSLVIYIATKPPKDLLSPTDKARYRLIHLKCQTGKLGSRDLRQQLSGAISFIERANDFTTIYILDETGKDLCIGVALAIICVYGDSNGFLDFSRPASCGDNIDKQHIRRRLAQISSAYPDANPSRATLNSVNAFLMSPT